MKKRNVISRFLLSTLLVSACLLLSSPLSFGDPTTTSNSSQTDCRLVPNPDDCYRKQSEQQWADSRGLPLSTSTFGWNGPLNAELKYDSDLAWILGLSYVQMLTEQAGLSIKLSGGANELRGNLTAGYAFSKDHQVKLTYEYLSQNLPFDFASGTINQWVSQYSLGAAYQYIVRNEILHSLELSGYATRAGSKNLSDVIFNQTPDSYDINFRRIAGGSENTILASANLFPFGNKNTTLTLGGGYSSVSYDMQYQNDPGLSTIAYKAELAHVLTPQTKLTTSINRTAAMTEYSAKVSHILPQRNLELSLKGQYNAGQAGMPNSSAVMVGFTYPAPKQQALGGFSELQELKNWIDKPVVYSARVLAIKDEMVQHQVFQSSTAIPDQTKKLGESIDPVNSADHFNFSDPSMHVTFDVMTTKVSKEEGTSAKASNVNYTHLLNLEIVPSGPNQIILKSKSPIPIDQLLVGSYVVSITATGTRAGISQPMVAKQSFNLTVLHDGPSWTIRNLPNMNIGQYYNGTPAGIDLNFGFVTPTTDTYTFTILSQDARSFLTVTPAGHLISTAPIPVTNTNDYIITLLATSNTGQGSTQKSFTLSVIARDPAWSKDSYDEPLTYGDSSFKVALNPLLTNTQGLNVTFQGGGSVDPSGIWQIVNNSGQFVLQQVPGKLAPGGTTTPLTLVATNTTSPNSDSAVFNMIVSQDTSLTVDWTQGLSGTLPGATSGQAYTPVNLNTYVDPTANARLLTTKNSSGTAVDDNYTFTITNQTGAGGWYIDPSDNVTLRNDNIRDTSNVTLTLDAVSVGSGKHPSSGPKDFTVTINQVPPVWSQPSYDRTMAYGDTNFNIPLNSSTDPLLTNTQGLAVTIESGNPDGIWEIVNNNGVLTLQQAPGKLAPITPPTTLVLAATNSTSTVTARATFNITVTQNANLTVDWTNGINALPEGTSGQAYTPVNLNTYVDQTVNARLLTTKNSSGTAIDDSYTFTITNQTGVGGWYIDPSDNVTLKNDHINDTGPVTLTLNAVSANSGKSPSSGPKDFTVTINQVPPIWSENTYNETMAYGDTGFNIPLNPADNPLITNTQGLAVTIESGNPDGIWEIVNNNGVLTLQQAPGKLAPITPPTTLVLAATNSTSTVTARATFNITVTQNANLTVDWTDNINALPEGTSGQAYTPVNLNTYKDQTLNARLITTKNSSGTAVDDSYTFTITNQTGAGGWYIDPSDNVTLKNDHINDTGPVTLTLNAVSANSGKSPSSGPKDFTVTINQVPPIWSENTYNETMAYGDTGFNIPLNPADNPLITNTQGLAVTIESGNPDGIWEVVNNNGVLTLQQAPGKLAPITPPTTLVLAATNSTSTVTARATFNITVTQNANLTVDWTQNLSGVILPEGTSGQAYASVNLNTYVDPTISARLLTTRNASGTAIDDSYTFKIEDQGGSSGWYIDPTDNVTLKNDHINDLAPVTLTLSATSVGSGKSAASGNHSFQVTINQALPKWNSDTGYNYDLVYGTPFSQKLNDLVINNQGLTVTFEDGSTKTADGVWEIVKDADGNVTLQQDAFAPIGSNQLPQLKATNTTSTGSDLTTVTVNVTQNTALTVDWTPGVNLPGAATGQPYSVNLNAYPSTTVKLLTTKDSSGTAMADDYTFTLVNPPQGWSIASDGVTLQNANVQDTNDVTLTLNAVSKISGKSPSDPKPFTITVTNVDWTSVNTLPVGGNGMAYSTDLNAAGIVATTVSGAPVSDQYTFTLVNPPTGWQVDSATGILTNNSIQGTSDVTLTLSAVSKNVAPGQPTSSAVTKQITIPVATVSWTTVSVLPNGGTGQPYSVDLNSAGLLTTTVSGASVSDSYTFTLVSAPSGDWKVDSATGILTNTNPNGIQETNDVTLTLSAVSKTVVPGLAPSTTTKQVTVEITNVDWTAVNTLPGGGTGQPYTPVDLNTAGLVTTTVSGAPVSDNYTFTLVNAPSTDWKVDPATGVLTNTNPNGIQEKNDVTLTLSAVSKTVVPGQPTSSAATKQVTIKMTNVDWTAVNTLPGGGTGQPYTPVDLNTAGLVTTTVSGAPVSDNYTFTLVNAPSADWKVDSATGMLTNSNPNGVQETNDVTLTLSAVSKTVVPGQPTSSAATKQVTIKMTNVDWTGVSTLPGAGTGQPYTPVDLNQAGLVATTVSGAPVSDSYTFTLVNAPSADWKVDSATGMLTNTNPNGVQETNDVTLTLSAVSKTVVPGQPTSSAATKQVTIRMTNVDWTGVSTLPGAGTGQPYTPVDLNQAGLVATTVSGAPVSDQYTFTLVNAPSTDWKVDSATGMLTNSNPNGVQETNDVTLTLSAVSKTVVPGQPTSSAATKQVTIKMTNVDWTAVNTLPGGGTGQPYTPVDLNQAGLVTTTVSGAPVSDSYTFTLVNAPSTDWKVDSTTGMLTNTNPNGVQETNDVTLTLSAVSKQVAPGQPTSSAVTKQVTIRMTNVDWTAVNTLPGGGTGQPYTPVDLNTVGLVSTTVSGAPVSDQYTFTLVNAPSADWKVDSATGMLTNTNPNGIQEKNDVTLTLSAVSKTVNPGQPTSSAATKQVTIKITNVDWTGVDTLPEEAIAGQPYSVDLNSVGLVSTTVSGNTVSDQYTFTLVNPPEGWQVNSDGILTNSNVQETSNVVLTLRAVSKTVAPGQITSSAPTKDITVNVLGVPRWNSEPTGTIKFDSVDVAADDAINLTGGPSPFITPTDPSFAIKVDANYPNWQVVQSQSGAKDWYLIRKTVNDQKISVEAGDVSPTSTPTDVTLIATNDAAPAGVKVNAHVTVAPDPAVSFVDNNSKYKDLTQRMIDVGTTPVTVSSNTDPIYTFTPGAAYTGNVSLQVLYSSQPTDNTMTFIDKTGLSWLSYSSSVGAYTYVTSTPTTTFGTYQINLSVTYSKASGALSTPVAVNFMPLLATRAWDVPLPSPNPPKDNPGWPGSGPFSYGSYTGTSNQACIVGAPTNSCRVVTAFTVPVAAGTAVSITYNTANPADSSKGLNVTFPSDAGTDARKLGLCAGPPPTAISTMGSGCSNTTVTSNGFVTIGASTTGTISPNKAPAYPTDWGKITKVLLTR